MGRLKEGRVTHTGMPKPLAVEIRETDDGIQLVYSLSRKQIDEVSGAVKFIDLEHHEIHEGDRFYVKNWLDITGAVNQDFLFVTPPTTKIANATWEIAGEAEFTITLYEGATVSNNGTPLAVFNHNRNSSKTPGVLAFSGPTVVSTGTQIWAGKIGSVKTATEARMREGEMMAKSGTNYLFRISHPAAGTEWLDYLFDWYEHISEAE